jgi:hypothetical protein
VGVLTQLNLGLGVGYCLTHTPTILICYIRIRYLSGHISTNIRRIDLNQAFPVMPGWGWCKEDASSLANADEENHHYKTNDDLSSKRPWRCAYKVTIKKNSEYMNM